MTIRKPKHSDADYYSVYAYGFNGNGVCVYTAKTLEDALDYIQNGRYAEDWDVSKTASIDIVPQYRTRY